MVAFEPDLPVDEVTEIVGSTAGGTSTIDQFAVDPFSKLIQIEFCAIPFPLIPTATARKSHFKKVIFFVMIFDF